MDIDIITSTPPAHSTASSRAAHDSGSGFGSFASALDAQTSALRQQPASSPQPEAVKNSPVTGGKPAIPSKAETNGPKSEPATEPKAASSTDSKESAITSPDQDVRSGAKARLARLSAGADELSPPSTDGFAQLAGAVSQPTASLPQPLALADAESTTGGPKKKRDDSDAISPIDPASAMLALLAAHQSPLAVAPASPNAINDQSAAKSGSAPTVTTGADAPLGARENHGKSQLPSGLDGVLAPSSIDPKSTTQGFVKALAQVSDAASSSGQTLAIAAPVFSQTPSQGSAASTVLSMATPSAFASSTTGFAVRALQDGTTQAVLRVTPEALGPVEAQIQISKLADGSSSLSMTLTLSNAQALETAKQSISDLQQSLAAAGLPPANLTLRLELPVAATQSNGSSQSSLFSGQQFDGSPSQGRREGSSEAGQGPWGSSDEETGANGWVKTRLFDKSA